MSLFVNILNLKYEQITLKALIKSYGSGKLPNNLALVVKLGY